MKTITAVLFIFAASPAFLPDLPAHMLEYRKLERRLKGPPEKKLPKERFSRDITPDTGGADSPYSPLMLKALTLIILMNLQKCLSKNNESSPIEIAGVDL